MSSPFVSEIRMFGFPFAPRGWALCNGQTLNITQNTALFSLVGATYGGDGVRTFGLPNLQGVFPIQAGQGGGLSSYVRGQKGGATTVTLTSTQVPAHNHGMNAQNAGGDAVSPVNGYLAQIGTRNTGLLYGSDAIPTPLASSAVANVGGNAAHNNLPPYQVLNYCIALQGIFPQRS